MTLNIFRRFKILVEKYLKPSSKEISFFVNQGYTGPQTQQGLDRFAPLTKEAFMQFINDQLIDYLQTAMKGPEHYEDGETGVSKQYSLSKIRTILRSLGKILVKD